MVIGQGSSQMRVSGNPASGMVVSNAESGTTRMTMVNGAMHMESSKMSMEKFAELISRFVDRPVVDMTELKGNYQVALDLSMDDIRNVARTAGMTIPAFGPAAEPGKAPADAASEPGGTVLTSVEQLGLKLEAREGSDGDDRRGSPGEGADGKLGLYSGRILMLRNQTSDEWFCKTDRTRRRRVQLAHLRRSGLEFDRLNAVQPMLDMGAAHQDARMVELANQGRDALSRRKDRIQRGGYAARVGCGVGVVIVGQLVFQAAGASLPSGRVGPLIHFLDEILHAGVAVFQELPVELQVEGTELVDRSDILKSIGPHQRFQAAILDGPAVVRERLAGYLLPTLGSVAVEEQAPAVATLGIGQLVGFGRDRGERKSSRANADWSIARRNITVAPRFNSKDGPESVACYDETMEEVKIGIVGLGNVGSGTLAILAENADQIALKLGFRLKVVAVCSRSVHAKELPAALGDVSRTTDWREVVSHPDVQIVAELVGGTGVAAGNHRCGDS